MTLIAHSSRDLLLVACALALAGCGGSGDNGIATASSSGAQLSSSGPAPATDSKERALQYVACLRMHGLDVPDPDPVRGKVRIQNTNQPAVQDAMRACRQYAPDDVDTGDQSGAMSQAREYAACMRTNGVANFPDPDPDKGAVFPKSVGNLPGFENADKTCHHILGDNPKPGGGK
jgi:hypothetical protein